MIAAGSGVSEIDRIFAFLRDASRPAKLAVQDRLVFRLVGDMSGHGNECLVWSVALTIRQPSGQVFGSAGAAGCLRDEEAVSSDAPEPSNHCRLDGSRRDKGAARRRS
jgi:hypothetical protein